MDAHKKICKESNNTTTKRGLKDDRTIVMRPQIPVDVTLEIFRRLPPESIGRFRTLSKLYYALLTNRNFTMQHLQSTIDDESNVGFLFLNVEDEPHDLITPPLTIDRVSFLPCSRIVSLKDGEYTIIWGYLHGLILVETHHDCLPTGKTSSSSPIRFSLQLKNPTTKEIHYLPESPPDELKKEGRRYHRPHYSFGYDSVRDDYKIVKVLCDSLLVHTYIYSCRNRSWTEIENFPLNLSLFECSNDLRSQYVGGKIYWIMSNTNGICGMVSLNLATERFEGVPQLLCHPFGGLEKDGDHITYPKPINLAVLDGKLCVYCTAISIFDANYKFYLFMMQDEGGHRFWDTLYTIDQHQDIFRPHCYIITITEGNNGYMVIMDHVSLRPLYMSNNGGHYLYLRGKGWAGLKRVSKLYVYDRKKQEVIKSVEIDNMKKKHVCVLKSLVSPFLSQDTPTN